MPRHAAPTFALFWMAACAVGDDTVFVDDHGSLYSAEVFCAGDFEGIRVSMVPGPELLDLPDDAQGCVRLRMAQTTQATFDVAINESFVLTGGTLEATIDCRVDAELVATATTATPLAQARGSARFVDGPDGTLSMDAELSFDGTDLPVRIGQVDVRRGACDVDFD
jgi:hypothetical protein